jgi:hypothetical protein
MLISQGRKTSREKIKNDQMGGNKENIKTHQVKKLIDQVRIGILGDISLKNRLKFRHWNIGP